MAMDGNDEFNDPSNYHYLTVASPSCHDVQPTHAWCVYVGVGVHDASYYHYLGVCVWGGGGAQLWWVWVWVWVWVYVWVPVSVCVHNTLATSTIPTSGFCLVP